ncbi:MAG: septum formation inhibitor Maf [Erysipelotrichia bacterium]|nr:septum formation inhibitor Maf [Erysipelotrichia bacterium]NCC55090.1 septum formation inhibitor Maf [Erysipelotrichia bacterium]
MQKVILASESPRRRELLSSLGINYTTCSSKIEEVFDTNKTIEEALMQVAYDKAKAVAENYPNDVVLGADTIVVVDHQILGKPKNDEEAKMMLKMLSGREHRVLTGTAIIYKEASECHVEETKVTFYDLDEEMIDAYVASKECKDKAGAYGIQGKGSILVKRIEGDYYNVVGLPLASTYRYLQKYIAKKNDR